MACTIRLMKHVTAVSLLVMVGICGCSNKLETGYQPRTIGSNETERRGYYAAPFTKEAREAREKMANDFDSNAGRARPGY